MLARPDMEQLAQRVIARYHLEPLSVAETAQYVAHRLAVAGSHAAQPIPARLAPSIHRLSGGIPRRINLLCDRALLGAYAEGRPAVTASVLRKAGAEVFGARMRFLPRSAVLAGGGAVLGLAAGALAMVGLEGVDSTRAERTPSAHLAQASPRSAMPAVRNADGGLVSPVRPGDASVVTVGSAAQGVQGLPAPVAAAGASYGASGQAGVPQAAPAQVTLAALKAVLHVDEAGALQALAGHWGEPGQAAVACSGIARHDLHCHRSRAGLFELRQLDRPAVIVLRAGADSGYALLQALDDSSAILERDGRKLRVPVTQLVQWFDGSFATFWRMPARFRPQLADGDRGPEVQWLRARLGLGDAQGGERAAAAIDRGFQQRLAEWQAAHQLRPDGRVGPKTYMKMNQASGVPEPRLLPAPLAAGQARVPGPVASGPAANVTPAPPKALANAGTQP
jgi:general secretion pathway protein A